MARWAWGRRRRIPKALDGTLAGLEIGEQAVIREIRAGHGALRRLADMGLVPGTVVRVLRRGPFGGPIEIEVRGTSLALGYGLASRILVERRQETVEKET